MIHPGFGRFLVTQYLPLIQLRFKMKKVFCDSCKIEIEKSSGNTVDIPCHIVERHMGGYVDSEDNTISGRRVSKDLCNKCWNTGWQAFVEATGLEE